MPRMWKLCTVEIGLVLLTACLLATPSYAQQQDVSANKTNVQKGKALAFGRSKGNCLACHQIAGGKLTGNLGPELANIKARYPDRNLLFKRIWDETKFNPQTPMPPFGRNHILTKQEINYIVDFLYTL